jgi:hypothetical protein
MKKMLMRQSWPRMIWAYWRPMQLCGTRGYATAPILDSYYLFKAQLEAFVEYLMTGVRPFLFSETIELMKIVIAGTRSRQENGREVILSEISHS